MKKILFSGLLIVVTVAAHAQTGVRLGLKAGVSLTSITGDYAQNLKSKFGFHAGLVANIGVTNRLSVQPELLYSQKGAPDNNGTGITNRLNYIELPVLLRFNARIFFFEAGPQLGLLVAAKQVNNGQSLDVRDQSRPIDFGYAFGLGHQFSRGVGAGLRYNGGFTTVDKAVHLGSATSQADQRNSAFQLYATYLFGAK